jgi:hypothetical protein
MTEARERFFQDLRTNPVVAGLRRAAAVERAIRHGIWTRSLWRRHSGALA